MANLGTMCSISRYCRNSEQNSPKWSIWKRCVPFTDIGTWNITVLIYQLFGNNVFHLQIGTRNKTVLINQLGNNVFPWQIHVGTQNKTVLIYQFGNSVFHLQIGTRNKTVLIYQFRNSVFHLQIGPLNEMFLSYTRVNVLFLLCKKAGPLIVNRNLNTKTRNGRH